MAAPSGTTWGDIAGGYGRVGIYIGTSDTNTQRKVTISTWFWSKYSCSDSNNSYYYNNNATSATSKVGSINISTSVDSGEGWSTSNQVKLGESTYTYDRGTSAVTRNCAIKLTDVDRVGAAMTHTRSYTIPALASYTVSYNANGGSGAPSSQTKYYGTDLQISSVVPTRTGYTFTGWALTKEEADNGRWYYSSGSMCGRNENLSLYAVWDANSYTYNIVYKSSSGIQLGTGTVAYDFGTTNTVNPKSFTGYTNPSSQSVKWDSTSAKTVTFTYTPTSYNVTIDCNGGSGVNSRIYTIETATFTLGAPTRTGYTFNGWTGSNGNTAQKTVSISKGSTGNKSYTAQWSTNVYTIDYNANGGTGNMGSQTVNWNDIFAVSNSDFKLEGYKFIGWNLYRNADSKWYVSGQGWVTENEIVANGYKKKLYNPQEELTLNISWIEENENARQFTYYAIWEISGIIYIDNGTNFESYHVYIDNGSSWDLYIPYVDDGTEWNIIS